MQIYDVSQNLAPGRHRLTICVDNSRHPPVNGGHQVSDDTQTDWNGIIGRIELRATDHVWLDNVQVYPDVKSRAAKVRIILGSRIGGPVSEHACFRLEAGTPASDTSSGRSR